MLIDTEFMNRSCVWFAVLITAIPASARIYNSDFTKCEKPLSQPSAFRRATEANTALAELGAAATLHVGDGRCSGSFISDEAHVLLASHCLDHCAKKSLEYRHHQLHDSMTCLVTINGVQTQAKVELMSPCSRDEVLLGQMVSLMNPKASRGAKCDEYTDLAILKPLKMPDDYNCLAMSDRDPNGAENLRLLSTPARTERGYRDADGKSLQLSEGQVLESDKCMAKAAISVMNRLLLSKVIEEMPINPLVLKYARSWKLWQTTVDLYSGSSGGPLLNKNSEIVAVASSMAGPVQGKESECKGATFFQPVSGLADAAKAWGGSFKLDQLKCEKRSKPKPKPEVPYFSI